jgi:peptidoglycan/xylan/chitin deacetylase (PgdA/CDA1 family)
MDDGPNAAWRPLWARTHVRDFERVLRLLKPHYEFISLAEAVQMIQRRIPLRPYCMVLTLDDGYRNNLTHALPILEKLSIPATFFVSTGMTDGRSCYWIDRIDFALQHNPAREMTIRIGNDSVPINLETRATLSESYLRLRLAMKRGFAKDFEQKANALAAKLEDEAGVSLFDSINNDPWAAVMNWDEIRRCSARGVEIGSHTVDHTRLSFVDRDTAANQLERSKAMLEENGVPCSVLAYPNGDYNQEVAALTNAAGYMGAVTTDLGLNRRGDNVYTLKRLTLPNKQSSDQVVALASGLQVAFSQLRIRIAI